MAVLFIVVLFVIKNSGQYENQPSESSGGLVYEENATLSDLVNSDSDDDGVLDWEEGLWGTDPLKKDSDDDGVPDSSEVSQTKAASARGTVSIEREPENLTETDKFSRELFSTVATLNQAGAMDPATVEQLGSSLAEHIQNSVPRKIFVATDIQTINDDAPATIQNYSDTLDVIYKKYPINKGVNTVLQEFLVDGENVDVNALAELTPIINQLNKIVSETIKVKVPKSIAFLHLDFVNSLQRLSENLSDIRLYESDVIVTLSAISQYERNLDALDLATNNLAKAVEEKLTN